MLAPPTIFYEFPSSIVKAVRLNRINAVNARAAVDLFLAMPLVSLEFSSEQHKRLVPLSYDTASRLGRSYYDAIFVVTASLLHVPLLTADRPLFDAAKSEFDVLWLGDFHLP